MLERAEAAYRTLHARSQELMRDMAASLPGGDTRTTTWFDPFPLVIEDADGSRMRDADGHVIEDFMCNYTALVHGHRPRFVTDAIRSELDRGVIFGAPMREHGELGDRITERLPSADLVRFTNSGTEANLLAARIARAVTGRRRVAVAEHSYHGSYEVLDWTATELTGTATLPVDDIDGTRAALDAAGPLAAVFIEPVLGSGGVIPVARRYLELLREHCDRTGAVLVFDEVMTFRLAYGGRQAALGIAPDLTVLGKVIGGGMPIGAVTGARRIMERSDPRTADAVVHGGTFNGHRLAMRAGAATLDALDAAAIERLNRLGDRLAGGIAALAERARFPISVTSCGSLVNVHAAPGVGTPQEAFAASRSPLARYLHLALINHGVFIAPRGELCISTAMSEQTVDRAIEAFAAVIAEA